jgi:hypothetical protein
MKCDTLSLLQRTAVSASGVTVVPIPGDPDTILVCQAGTYTARPLPPKHRDHKVFDIDSLLDLADKNGAKDDGGSYAVIWHSEEAVVAVLNDAERRDFATLKLEYSKAFAALRKLNTPSTFDQPAFVRLLKTDLAACVPGDLLAAVRSLKFIRNEEGKSELKHGESSLGRSVESKITGAGAIPETFIVSTNVYANALQDETREVAVAIDIDMEAHQFCLSVIGDGLSNAVLETQEALSGRLMEGNENRRVLFGKP